MPKLPDNLNIIKHAQGSAHKAGIVSAILMQIVDCGLAGVIFVVPLVMGGRHPMGQLLLVSLAVITSLAWALRQSISQKPSWRPTWALALIAAGAFLVLLQSIPLPQALLERLAPHNTEILPLWHAGQTGAASLGDWSFLSFTPEETRAGLVLFLSYGLIFFVTVQRIKAIEDVERLLQWFAVAVMCMAAFGLVQYLVGNGKFFWLYNHPFSNTFDGAKGSFTNKNHFAHFLALGVGPLVWWLLHFSRRKQPQISHAVKAYAFSKGRSRTANQHSFNIFSKKHSNNDHTDELKTYFLGLGLAVVLFAGFMSLSRGGMAALFIAVVVSTTVCYFASVGAGRFVGILLSACVLMGVALSVFGLDHVGRRLETLTSASATQKDRFGGRLDIWKAVTEAMPNYIVTGAGVGSFCKAFPMHAVNTENDSIEFTHAENSYLQVLFETGVVGFGLLIAGIVMCYAWCTAGWKGTTRTKACAGAIAGSLAAGTSQALVDFVWYVPACAAVMAILAACAFRIKQFAAVEPSMPKSFSVPRWIPATVAIVLLPISAWMINSTIGAAMAASYWEQYLIALKTDNAVAPSAVGSIQTANQTAANAAIQRELKLINTLETAIYWQPSHADAQLALAEAELRLFDKHQASSINQMDLMNIRNAAIDSHFPSQETLNAWLAKAFGDHWVHLASALKHTRQSLALCPLQGCGYIYLSKLSFLDGKHNLSPQDCVNQSLRVRPFDGAVVYAAAAEALLAGDTRQWLELSKRAFHCGRAYRQQLIANLVANTPPEGIPGIVNFIITQFKPDLENLNYLYAVCATRTNPEQLIPLCQYQALRAESEAGSRTDPGAAGIWLEAQRLHTYLKNGPQALQCAQRALQCDQNNYRAHYQLALCLIDQKSFADAESHLHWCLRRTPGDKGVENKLKEALKGRLEAERTTAAQKSNNF